MPDIVLENLGEKLLEMYYSPPRQGVIHPSQLAAGCKLRSYYDLICAEYAEDYNTDPAKLVMYQMGFKLQNIFEEALKRQYEELGGIYLIEVPLTISEHCKGTCDGIGILEDQKTLFEFKSIGKSGFENLSGPLEPHVFQTNLYNTAVNASHIVFIYVCRDNGAWRSFVLQRDEEKEQEALTIVKDIEESFAKGTPPDPQPHWSYTGKCTSTCLYRKICPATSKQYNQLVNGRL